ncbi:hypothetical protein [Cystobacter fuscus]|uniref:hypothetical protein n=1 Tax=Cystobacter fuscus TaxID=43 RepID=UPI002B312C33|nr:hypothetical protein F0U63_16730 [Cystobacter fuscus]
MEEARQQQAAAQKLTVNAQKAAQTPGQTPDAAKMSKAYLEAAIKAEQKASAKVASTDKALQAAEEKVALTTKKAETGADHYETNNASTPLEPGQSSLTLTEETRFNAKGEPAVSKQKTESVSVKLLAADKNGNGVQVVRTEQQVNGDPASFSGSRRPRERWPPIRGGSRTPNV